MKRIVLLLGTASCLASYTPTRVQISTIPSNVTTTVVTAVDTGLSVNLDVNTLYVIRGFCRVTCSGTGGLNVGFVSPAGAVYGIFSFGQTTGATVYNRGLHSADGLLTSTDYNTFAGSGFVTFDGKVTNGATAGVFKLQYASIVNGETSTVHATESYLKAEKVYP